VGAATATRVGAFVVAVVAFPLMRRAPRLLHRPFLPVLAGLAMASAALGAPVHTTYLWHMHQPIYWPERSTWNGRSYEHAFETITLGHGRSDVFSIFNSDDRVRDYQDYPKLALASILDLPDAGAQLSFAGSLIQNVSSLASAGWNGGRYAPNWHQPTRDAMAWSTSGGRRRLEPLLVSFHHPINPLIDEAVFRRMIQAQKAIAPDAWGAGPLATGFFPAEMCFSQRLIPVLASEGIGWSIVPDIHIARACADYPYDARQDNCDPPNRADRINPAQGFYQLQTISRGVTTKVPVPYALRPHRARHVDPATGEVSSLVVVPAANAMSWNEGYGLYGTGEIDAIASRNDPANPMLVVLAHDGDNAWSGGHSYYTENVTQFSHAAAARGYEPTTIAEYLADHPVPADDVAHVEDGGWVNADGDFGSPQFINWNWPLVSATGSFDIPNGWAEDERNWAVLTAATHRVLAAEAASASPDMGRVVDPTRPGTTTLERAWHFLLAGHESGYMYYGKSLDFEIKPTLAANRAVEHADSLLGGADVTAPTIWLPQRLPWNPGGRGGGALWGYPSGAGAAMSQDFHVWTFVHDVSDVAAARLMLRVDQDGVNPIATTENETYAGGPGVGPWQALSMNRRVFPKENVFDDPEIDFWVLPTRIADQYWFEVTGFHDVLLDYYVEAEDVHGNRRRSPIQHVWVDSAGTPGGGPAVSWSPADPVAGDTLAIEYDPVPGVLPDATDPVRIHVGHSGWTSILTPDPVMTRLPGATRFRYVYTIPSIATSVDFVFNDGAGNWDNNGGADWHVPVSGGSGPPHVIDGTRDAGVPLVASCGALELHADYDGRHLYLAATPVGQTAGADHFVFVSRADGPARAAPWAKSGTVPAFDLVLGNEDGNGWAGWFDGAGAQPTAGLQRAVGSSLEGMIDVLAAWGVAPPSVRVSLAAYATPDGGVLTAQAPCGDGDGDLEDAERVTVVSAPVAVSGLPAATRGPTIRLTSANPASSRLRAVIETSGDERVRVELVDLQGRVAAVLHDGGAAGRLEVASDLGALRSRGRVGAGVLFLRARTPFGEAMRRVVVIP
jgi:hypothetical protein